ncbi:MAG: J domain-containing protein [Deltaproteobacteria bacterium]|nr:J domain-containing protein [Deltaproteobacteria bacterium]
MARVPTRLADSPGERELTPDEDQIFSLIDSRLDEDEIAFVAGMSSAQTAAALERLERLGLVKYEGRGEIADATEGGQIRPADEIAMGAQMRARVDELFPRLEALSDAELLHVAPSASLGEIRKAYYALAPDFHPDKYFRKNLGPYKAKIEAIFGRMTDAYEKLRAERRRAGEAGKGTEPVAAPGAGPPPQGPAGRGTGREQAGGRRGEIRPADELRGEAPARAEAIRAPAPGRAAAVREPARPRRRVEIDPARLAQAQTRRRQALAAKLGRRPGGGPPGAFARPGAGGGGPEQAARQAARGALEGLRQRQKRVRAVALRRQCQHFVNMGQRAFDDGDYEGAATAYHLALAIAPDDPELVEIVAEMERLVAGE